MTGLFGYEYVQGYTAALQDVEKVFRYISEDMRRHKMPMNQKNLQALVQCMIDNRVILREEPDAFICCTQDKGFEVHIATWRTHRLQDGYTRGKKISPGDDIQAVKRGG